MYRSPDSSSIISRSCQTRDRGGQGSDAAAARSELSTKHSCSELSTKHRQSERGGVVEADGQYREVELAGALEVDGALILSLARVNCGRQ